MAQLLLDEARRLQHFVDVHAARDPKTIQHVEKILRREIARRAGGVRASSEAAGRRVECRHAELQRREDVRQRGSARVVEVQRDPSERHASRRSRVQSRA